MKILTNSRYKELLNTIEHHEKTIIDTQHRLMVAENLKEVLMKIAEKTGIPRPEGVGHMTLGIDLGLCQSYSPIGWSNKEIVLSDNVLQYVDDILGGKVIKQEANKVIVIAKDGTVKTGPTKSNNDKGYSYKLVRE